MELTLESTADQDLEQTQLLIDRGRFLNDQKMKVGSAKFGEWLANSRRAKYNRDAMKVAKFVDKYPEWEYSLKTKTPEELIALSGCKSEDLLIKILNHEQWLTPSEIKRVIKVGSQSDAAIPVLLAAKPINCLAIAGEEVVTVTEYPKADNLVKVLKLNSETGESEEQFIDYRFLQDPGKPIKSPGFTVASCKDWAILAAKYNLDEEALRAFRADYQHKLISPGEIELMLLESGYAPANPQAVIEELSLAYEPKSGDRVELVDGRTGIFKQRIKSQAIVEISGEEEEILISEIQAAKLSVYTQLEEPIVNSKKDIELISLELNQLLTEAEITDIKRVRDEEGISESTQYLKQLVTK